jgi:[protein-PII] uridylyltransferase
MGPRAGIQAEREALREAYLRHPRPRVLLRRHAQIVDRVVKALWSEAAVPGSAALVATGGYGRGELYPYSDIDLLVLLAREPEEAERPALERLIGSFWDAGLEIGHSVRTVEGCAEAAADITVRTALLEARYLAGSRSLFRQLERRLAADADAAAFFKAKKLEQEQRHAKHQDTPYSLEPNLKEAPGGLRDLQVIQWIARASGMTSGFGRRWSDLMRRGLIERDEAAQLARHEALLQDLRIRLHYLAGRREDRIVFDLQTALAAQLGYHDTGERRASEAMMQRYYQTAKGVTQLNAILLQNLEAMLAPLPDTPPRPLNERFEIRSGLLHVRREDTFRHEPTAILESFLLMMQHQELRGMTARTLRALYRARFSIDSAFRRNPIARLLFLHILQQPRGIVHEFRRMNQYGILGRYLPEFGRIVGQMHPDGDPQPAPLHHARACARVSARERADERLRAALAPVRRRALSRHRQGPRWGPFAARRTRCPELLQETSTEQGRRRPRGLPRREPPADVARGAEAGRLRPGGGACVCRPPG